MFLRGDRSIEIEMAGKSREIDPSDEFQDMPDEEVLLKHRTPNESFVQLMTTMNDNITAILDSMSWMGYSLKDYMMPPALQAD